MLRSEIEMLGTYNAECARGIAHRADWNARMAVLQAKFNQETKQMAELGMPLQVYDDQKDR